LTLIGQAFALIFVIEAIIKIIAKGLVFGKETYLRDPWNILDFIIVITRYYKNAILNKLYLVSQSSYLAFFPQKLSLISKHCVIYEF
jgi:hypothetical protein